MAHKLDAGLGMYSSFHSRSRFQTTIRTANHLAAQDDRPQLKGCGRFVFAGTLSIMRLSSRYPDPNGFVINLSRVVSAGILPNFWHISPTPLFSQVLKNLFSKNPLHYGHNPFTLTPLSYSPPPRASGRTLCLPLPGSPYDSGKEPHCEGSDHHASHNRVSLCRSGPYAVPPLLAFPK